MRDKDLSFKVFIGISILIVVIGVVLILAFSKAKEGSVESNGSVPSGELWPPAGTPKVYGEIENAQDLQNALVSLYFDEETSYYMEYRGVKMESRSFARLFYPEYGNRIDLSEVQIGDIAESKSGVTGICIGFYEKLPIFIYSATVAAGGNTDGLCLGYVRGQRDKLFYGMYPIEYEQFYKGYATPIEHDSFAERIKDIPLPKWYVDLTYEYSRAMSRGEVDLLLTSVNVDVLSTSNLKLNRDSYANYLVNLPQKLGVSSDYRYMVRTVDEKGEYTKVVVAVVDMGSSMLMPTICNNEELALTLYPAEKKFLPCGVDALNHMEIGFVRASDVQIGADGKVFEKEIIYGQTVDEEGKPIFRLEDGTVIYLNRD